MSKTNLSTVVWSGGADSTLALVQECKTTSEAWPIQAVTLVKHPQLHTKHQASERKARKRFLKWAKKKGYHINHIEIAIKGKGDGEVRGGGQPGLWLLALAPYWCVEETRVVFGYIKTDVFWQWFWRWKVAFEGIRLLFDAKWLMAFPLESMRKEDVFEHLADEGVPDDAWWSCDEPEEVGAPCGECAKCREVKRGKKELKKRRKRARSGLKCQ